MPYTSRKEWSSSSHVFPTLNWGKGPCYNLMDKKYLVHAVLSDTTLAVVLGCPIIAQWRWNYRLHAQLCWYGQGWGSDSLSCLNGVEQFSKSFSSCSVAHFLVLWWEIVGFCWWLFFCTHHHLQIASFFSSKSNKYEAKIKIKIKINKTYIVSPSGLLSLYLPESLMFALCVWGL